MQFEIEAHDGESDGKLRRKKSTAPISAISMETITHHAEPVASFSTKSVFERRRFLAGDFAGEGDGAVSDGGVGVMVAGAARGGAEAAKALTAWAVLMEATNHQLK
ncbi:MAG: hypothetical protein H7343_17580 [Undibacterium sp.]|nr:hypothetical protein [Opitutaceae bacterium]